MRAYRILFFHRSNRSICAQLSCMVMQLQVWGGILASPRVCIGTARSVHDNKAEAHLLGAERQLQSELVLEAAGKAEMSLADTGLRTYREESGLHVRLGRQPDEASGTSIRTLPGR